MDIFDFVNELPQDLNITLGDLLVSYDVSSLCTNVPETVKILMDRAFRNNWFNSEYELNISKEDHKYGSFGCGYQGPAFPIQWLLI